MKDKTNLYSLLMLCLLAAVTAVGVLTVAQPAEAAIGGGWDCPTANCSGGFFTAQSWGKASDCQTARSRCTLGVYGDAHRICEKKITSNGEPCDFQPISYSNCYWSNGMWVVDCVMQHRCEICQF